MNQIRQSAADRFARLVERQGGDPRVLDEGGRLPAAPVLADLEAPASGWLAGLDARQIGLAAVELGAGRTRVGDDVDPAVGFELHKQVGEEVESGEPLITVHAANDNQVERARQRLSGAILIEEAEPPARATVRYRVTAEGATPL